MMHGQTKIKGVYKFLHVHTYNMASPRPFSGKPHLVRMD